MEFALGLQQPDGTFHGDPGSMTLDGEMMTRPFAQRCWFCRKRALRRLRRTTASCSFVYEDDSWVQGSFRSLALQSSWACWSPTPDHGARDPLHLLCLCLYDSCPCPLERSLSFVQGGVRAAPQDAGAEA